MRVSELTREKRVTVSIDLGEGDVVEVQFDRNRVTPAWVALAEQRDAENDTYSLPKALAEVILTWDVYKDAAGDFPATPENIGVLSYPVQRDLLKRIVEEAVPSRAEGNGSSEPPSTPPSGFVAPVETPQNGAVTSPSPSDSVAASLR